MVRLLSSAMVSVTMLSVRNYNRFVALLLLAFTMSAGAVQPIRRPVSPTQPMWIFHIDTWNIPDPEKIIQLVPEDVRPFVVFNISLSSNDNLVQDGPRIIDSWLSACAAQGVWCMVQPSSGAHSRLPEIGADGTGREVFESYYQNYPNFIGFNYAEQFWDFGAPGCPTWDERLETLYQLLQLAYQYGGYLTMNFTQAYDSYQMMPMAILKDNSDIRDFLRLHPEHFICSEKYTMKKGFYMIESDCLGMFLSGYAGHYGIRFDTSGWMTNSDDRNDSEGNTYVESAGLLPMVEHMLLTGQSVIDGPELFWEQVSRTAKTVTGSDGYRTREHMLYVHALNLYVDIFRKILSGEWRIATRREVINRTQICVLNDLTTGTRAPYIVPQNLYDGLYRLSCDSGGVTYGRGWQDQRWWTKRTGRYPAIPMVYDLADTTAMLLEAIPMSTLSQRWPTISAKQQELNARFADPVYGEIFVARTPGRCEYVAYNPYQYLDYVNNGKRVFRNATRRTSGFVSDFVTDTQQQTLHIYLNNYRNQYNQAPYTEWAQTTDTIWLYGPYASPTVTWADRGNHSPSTVTSTYADYTLRIVATHNGPLDITISGLQHGGMSMNLDFAPYSIGVISAEASGTALTAPAAPSEYCPTIADSTYYCYEVENMDYKGGYGLTQYSYPGTNPLSGYSAQGYVQIMPHSGATIRDTLTVAEAGVYRLGIRYRNAMTTSAVPMRLTLNGQTYVLTNLTQANDWQLASNDVVLQQGVNEMLLGFSNTWGTSRIELDCVLLQRIPSSLTGLNNTSTSQPFNPSTPTYNILGQPVDGDYRGVLLRPGQKQLRQ